MADPAAGSAPGVTAQRRPGRFAILRGDLGDGAFADAVDAAGLQLPATPGTFWRGGERRIYWLGPDEWLLADFGAEASWAPPALAAGTVVDVTGGYAAWRLTGPRANDVLRQASSYDSHPRAFPTGRCAHTVFAKTTALIAAEAAADTPEGATYDVLVRRSYSDYLRKYLATAAAEHGVAFAAPPR